jgi:tryptophan 7-halogenase
MHVCIVGTGAAGWITCHDILFHSPFVKKITIIGSPAIPTVGVGESTTMIFREFIEMSLGFSRGSAPYKKFLKDIDAAIKYGVFYENWSKNNYLHPFVGSPNNLNYGYLLGKKSINDTADDCLLPLKDRVFNNEIYTEHFEKQHSSFHFDANKLISALEKLAEPIERVIHIKDTVVKSVFEGNTIKQVILNSGEVIEADYFVSCVGQTAFNQRIFREEYVSYSDVLLTDKALFYPLKYKDKEKEFHPYTVAKTMKHGWRWITPTWNRIGTGYAFSSRHTTVEEAIEEFVNDIGDPTIKPNIVDFYPRKVKEVFKVNHCVIGLAAGFLEPLDAPGISLTLSTSGSLATILSGLRKTIKTASLESFEEYTNIIKDTNHAIEEMFNFWASFILCQYKTCHRNDTKFWKDHKNVQFEFYDNVMKEILNPTIKENKPTYSSQTREPWMFYNTMAGKDISWDVKIPGLVEPVEQAELETVSHYDYFKEIHGEL